MSTPSLEICGFEKDEDASADAKRNPRETSSKKEDCSIEVVERSCRARFSDLEHRRRVSQSRVSFSQKKRTKKAVFSPRFSRIALEPV
jgi:hypothetical protein